MAFTIVLPRKTGHQKRTKELLNTLLASVRVRVYIYYMVYKISRLV